MEMKCLIQSEMKDMTSAIYMLQFVHLLLAYIIVSDR